MLLKLLKAEKMKLKRSPVWLAFLLMPVIPAALGTANYLYQKEVLTREWLSLWTQHTLFTDYFFLPIMLGIYCAYIMRLENANNNWNLEKAISEHKVSSGKTKKETNNNDTLEEMLLLLRKQSSILSSPQQLLPEDYFEHIWERYLKSPNSEKNIDLCFEIIDYLSWILSKAEVDTTSYNLLEQLGFYNLIDILGRYINRRSNRRLYMNYLNLRDKYRMIASQKISVVDTIGIQDEDIMS